MNFLLIPIYGTSGAAIATAVSLCVYSVIMVYYMKKLLRVSFDIKWYSKTLVLTSILLIINDVAMDISRIHIPKIIIAVIGIILIWSYLLTSEEKKYLFDVVHRKKQEIGQFFLGVVRLS
jgi:O-antigen/teichoic acid export membrane protein